MVLLRALIPVAFGIRFGPRVHARHGADGRVVTRPRAKERKVFVCAIGRGDALRAEESRKCTQKMCSSTIRALHQ